jgi:hypothetical protein
MSVIAIAWFKCKSNSGRQEVLGILNQFTMPYHEKAKWHEGFRLLFKLVFVMLRDAFGLSHLSKIVFLSLLLMVVAWIEGRQRPYKEQIANDISTM